MAQHDMTTTHDAAYDVTGVGSGAIAAYLQALGHELRRRDDCADILAETEDHLWLATDQLAATGLAPYEAERAAVERFGRPELLARTWTTVPTADRPVMAEQAAIAGVLGIAVFVVSSLAYELYAISVPWDPTTFHVWSAVAGFGLLLAGAPLLSVLAQPGRRAWGPQFVIGAGLLALASGWFFAGMAWFWPVPGTAFGLVAMLALWRGRGARPWLAVTALAWPLGTAAYVIGDTLNLGPMDRWYLHPVLPPVVGFWLGVTLMSVGIVAVSLRLLRLTVPSADESLAHA